MRVYSNIKAVSINVRFPRAEIGFIVFDARHALVSRFSKPVPSACKATAMETGLKSSNAANGCNRIEKSIVLLENILEFRGKCHRKNGNCFLYAIS